MLDEVFHILASYGRKEKMKTEKRCVQKTQYAE
jgi:hypothetical protein